MNANIIVAHNNKRVIGKEGKIPWRLKEDLRRFKEITLGHPIVMGRKTADTLPKPLPDRRNIVMSRRAYKRSQFERTASVEEVVKLLGEKMFFVVGGEQIYKLFLPFCNKIYCTKVEDEEEGDAFFPKIELWKWKVADKVFCRANRDNSRDAIFLVLERKAAL